MIVVGFSRSNNFLGWLIRKATGGNWNHAWVGYTDPVWGGQWVTHAISDGVIPQRVELLKKNYDDWMCFEVVGLDIEEGMRKARNYVNKKYDFKAVILNGILLALYKVTGVEWFNPIINHNKVSCSEFVALILQGCNFEPVMGKDAEMFPPDGPMGLFPIFKKSGHMREVDFERWAQGGASG
jgi:hypothetical protein